MSPTATLEARVAALEAQVKRLAANGLRRDGSIPMEGPLQHVGTTVGVFGVTPVAQPASGGTLNGLIAALRALGLVSS